MMSAIFLFYLRQLFVFSFLTTSIQKFCIPLNGYFFEILDNDFEFGFLNNKAITIMSASKTEAHKNVQSIANIYTRLVQFGLNVITPNEPALLHTGNQIHRLGFQYQYGQTLSKDHQKIIHHQLSRALKFSAFFNAPQTNLLRSSSNAA